MPRSCPSSAAVVNNHWEVFAVVVSKIREFTIVDGSCSYNHTRSLLGSISSRLTWKTRDTAAVIRHHELFSPARCCRYRSFHAPPSCMPGHLHNWRSSRRNKPRHPRSAAVIGRILWRRRRRSRSRTAMSAAPSALPQKGDYQRLHFRHHDEALPHRPRPQSQRPSGPL